MNRDEDVIEWLRKSAKALGDDLASVVRRAMEEERERLRTRAERVERRYDKLTALADRLRSDLKRIDADFDEPLTDVQLERLRGMRDGTMRCLREIEGLL